MTKAIYRWAILRGGEILEMRRTRRMAKRRSHDGLLKSRETASPSPSQPPAADARHVPPLAMLTPAPGTEDGGALLPCPFCGGVAAYMTADEAGPDAYVVTCMQCHASSAVHYAVKESPREKAIAAWNRRAAPSAPAEGHADEIVSRLYRRFKEWSKRGFGADDVTWCEVKADIEEIFAAELTRLAAEVERWKADALNYSKAYGDAMERSGKHTIDLIAAEERAEAAEARAARAEKVVEAADALVRECNPPDGFDLPPSTGALERLSFAVAAYKRASTPSGEGGGT